MELNINSPLYYKDHYGIDDDIYRFCQDLYLCFKDKNYSNLLTTIGIIPILAPSESYANGEWKEHVSMIGGNTVATIHIRMDLEQYLLSDETGKKQMYLDMLTKAVKKVKSKGKLDFEAFSRDLESYTNTK